MERAADWPVAGNGAAWMPQSAREIVVRSGRPAAAQPVAEGRPRAAGPPARLVDRVAGARQPRRVPREEAREGPDEQAEEQEPAEDGDHDEGGRRVVRALLGLARGGVDDGAVG